MRGIKVKAWHKKMNRMFSAEELGRDQMTLSADGRGLVNISGRSTEESVFYGETMIPLEYTGMKDKNGKEIYEGDIVDEKYKWQIVFEDGAFYCEQSTFSRQLLWEVIHKRYKAQCPLEIIGNIYESPELLKQEERL